MNPFGWLKRLFGGTKAHAAPQRRVVTDTELLSVARGMAREMVRTRVRATYDAASEDDANRRHWQNADDLGPAAEHDASTRAKLRKRSRYERKNNGVLYGLVRTYADDFVGTGPKLQLTGKNPRNKPIEKAFRDWARASGLAAKLHLLVRSKVGDGEAFALIITNEKVDDPVKLDLFPVEADLVATPGFFGFGFSYQPSDGYYDGIKYDASGNPVAYTVLREHPGEMLFSFPGEFDTYPASQVLHWFRVDRPGQLRGIPEITPSLGTCAQTRRWKKATIGAAETAASFAALMSTAVAEDENADQLPPAFDKTEIEHNMLMNLPPNSSVTQMRAENPNTLYGDFSWEQMKEMGRPLCMPANIVAGDSSRSNFASAKMDHYGYRTSLRVEREFAESPVLERVFRAWHSEARLIPGHPAYRTTLADLPHVWAWPGWISWDKQEAKDDTERLANGTSNLAEIYAEWGQDWREQLEVAAEVAEYAQSLGLGPTGTPAPPAAPEPAPEPEEEEPVAPDDREEALAAVLADLALRGSLIAARAKTHTGGHYLQANTNQPRDKEGQWASTGTAGGGGSDDEADRQTARKRAEEDDAAFAADEKEDAKVARLYEQEDARVDRERAREDRELNKEQGAVEKEREKLDTARDKEDRRVGKERDKEDEAHDAEFDKRDAEISKARAKEDDRIDKEREAETKTLKTGEEKAAAEERWAKEDGEIDTRRAAEDRRDNKAREDAADAIDDRRKKENAERDARRAAEDKALDAREGAVKEKRAKVDERREAEDEAESRNRDRARRERERWRGERDADRAQRRREEDAAHARAREREQRGRENEREERDAHQRAEREKQDAAVNERREEQDPRTRERREKEDKDKDAEREDENKAIDERRAAEDAQRGAKA